MVGIKYNSTAHTGGATLSTAPPKYGKPGLNGSVSKPLPSLRAATKI